MGCIECRNVSCFFYNVVNGKNVGREPTNPANPSLDCYVEGINRNTPIDHLTPTEVERLKLPPNAKSGTNCALGNS